jgi:hypothetical protein
VAQLWEEVFKKSVAEMTTVNTKFIHTSMQCIPGWALSRVPQDISGYGKQRVYYRQVAKVAEPVNVAKVFEDFI